MPNQINNASSPSQRIRIQAMIGLPGPGGPNRFGSPMFRTSGHPYLSPQNATGIGQTPCNSLNPEYRALGGSPKMGRSRPGTPGYLTPRPFCLGPLNLNHRLEALQKRLCCTSMDDTLGSPRDAPINLTPAILLPPPNTPYENGKMTMRIGSAALNERLAM